MPRRQVIFQADNYSKFVEDLTLDKFIDGSTFEEE